MSKLLFMIILLIMLEMAYPVKFNIIRRIFPLRKLNFLSRPSKTVEIPKKDLARGSSTSVHYRPLIVEELESGKLDFPMSVKYYLFDPESISEITSTYSKIKFYCPDENDEESSCFFPSQQFCTVKARPVIELFRNGTKVNREQASTSAAKGAGSEERCGPIGEGIMYMVKYQLCSKTNSEGEIVQEDEFQIFFFCYDHTKKETIYVKYFVPLPRLLFEKKLNENEEIDFKMSIVDDGYFDNFFKTVENSYTQSKSAYEANQLVSPKDLAQDVWKIPTFHFVNTRPLHKDLLQIWDKIGELIMSSWAARENELHFFCVGAFKITKRRGNVEYVYEKNIEIPELWIKVVIVQFKNESVGGLAILMNNASKDLNLKQDNLCKQNLCDNPNRMAEVFGELADARRYVRCCPITERILSLFNLEGFDAEHIVQLMIDNLTEW